MSSTEQKENGLNVIIAEDDGDIANLIGAVVVEKMPQASVTIYPDIDEADKAIKSLAKNPPGLIFFDLYYRKSGGGEPIIPDGFTYLQSELENPNSPLKRSKIVAMTASPKSGIREKLEELGIFAFLEKPFDLEQLEVMLEQATTKHE